MESVEDIDNEEALVEDEPQILHGPSHDGPSNENQAFIQGNNMWTIFVFIDIVLKNSCNNRVEINV